jgi:ubiquinone/menaquinone biosynthesis C-methylase UbiE
MHTAGHTLHFARLYDLSTGLLRVGKLHRRLLDAAGIAPGDRVLDVGCGPGRLTRAAARAAGASGETVGIDPSGEMIGLAERKGEREGSTAKFRLAAIEAIPAPDGHFDVVLASLMLHHLPDDLQRRGLAEVLRVLKPTGRFVAGDFSAMPGHGLGHIVWLLGLRRGTAHAEHLRSALAATGFESVELRPGPTRALCVLSARKRILSG